MNAITLRNLPPELAEAVRKEAERKRISVNKAVISLLERKAEGHKKKSVRTREYADLDAFAGVWTKKEAAEFDKALTAQRALDSELWK